MRHNSHADIHGNLKLRGVVVDDLTTQGSFYSEQFGEVAYKSELGAGGGGDIDIRESDGDPPTFTAADTLVFDSYDFYLSATSTGKPTVSLRFRDLGGSTYEHTQDTPNVEWIVNHNLNQSPVLAQAFGVNGKMIGFDEVDVGDPDVSYFYFTQAIAGSAIIVGRAAGPAMDITDGTHIIRNVSELNVNDSQFYLSAKGSGEPVLNWELNTGFSENEVILSRHGKNVFWDWSDGNAFILPLERNRLIHTPSGATGEGRAQQIILVTKQPAAGFYNLLWSKKFIFSGGEQAQPFDEPNSVDLFSMHYSPYLDKIVVAQIEELFY
jgi:hypothetical protein